ncbi:TPA: hypothetical protein EYP70_05900 [Candidatus Bathyarchaeota archaeon]|nr:hypothetical protein [Candidatus Bathyarchaeota archaeon]
METEGILLSQGVAKKVRFELGDLGRDEVLIETKACGICMGEIHVYRGKLPGGRVMGHEGVGVVAEVGEDVNNVEVGDKVTTLGGPALAKYYKTKSRNVAKIPPDMRDYALWISEPLACAVNGIRGASIEIGDNVCLIGCGYMGLLLLQAMPKNYIISLIALDIRDERLELAKEFGADYVLNPRNGDPVERIKEILGGEADVVIEASGAYGTLYLATHLVRTGGKLVIFGRHVIDEKVPTEKWHIMGLRILNTAPHFSSNFNKDFHDAVNLLKKGVFNQECLITHRFPFEDPKTAFEEASQKPLNYVKGVITF